MDVDHLSGRAFETICPGYNAEATLSVSFSIDALEHTHTSEQVLIANHMKWKLNVLERRDKNGDWLTISVTTFNGEISKYPISLGVEYSLEAGPDCCWVSTARYCYEDHSHAKLCEVSIPFDVLHNNRHKYQLFGKMTVAAQINVSLPMCYNFNVPNTFSDVTLNVGDVSFPFNKAVLAVHSSFFNAMFFGSFKESQDNEVILEDVEVAAFVNLVNALFVRSFEVKTWAVTSVLKLADRLGIMAMVDYCEKLLLKCELYSNPCLAERLVIATNYSLQNLQKRCLELCTSAEIIKKVAKSPFYKELHSDGKALLLDRMLEVMPETNATANQ